MHRNSLSWGIENAFRVSSVHPSCVVQNYSRERKRLSESMQVLFKSPSFACHSMKWIDELVDPSDSSVYLKSELLMGRCDGKG